MSRSQRRKNIFSAFPSTSTSSSEGRMESAVDSRESYHQDLWQTVIVFLFHLLFFATPLLFTWVNEELFEFNKMIFTYGITFLVLGAWVGRMIYQKKLFVRRSPIDIFILLFFLSQVLSTIFSIHPYTSFFGYYTRFHGGLLSTFCYITLFYAFISNVEKKHLRSLFLSIFGSAFLVMLMAIPEHFGHSFSCFLIGTSQDTKKNGWGALSNWANLLSHYDASCWIQDVQDRVFASFGQPNWLAAYAITLLPLSAIFSLPWSKSKNESTEQINREKLFPTSRISQVFYLLMTVLLFAGLLFTKSRSGVAGIAGGVAYFVLLQLIFFFRNKKISDSLSSAIQVSVGGLLVLLVGIGLFFGTPYTPNFGEKMLLKNAKDTVITSDQPSPATVNRLDVGGTDSGEIRKIVWEGAIKVWLRRPIFGSGVETFAYSYYQDRPLAHNLVSEWDFLYNKAHNEFLNFLATTGIVGLVAYLLLLGAFIKFSVTLFLFPELTEKIFKRIPLTKNFAVSDFLPEQNSAQTFRIFVFASALSSGLVALSISNFFGFSTVMVTILLFLYPAFFLVAATNEEKLKQERHFLNFSLPAIDQTGRTLSYIVIGLVTLVLLYWVVNMWQADKLYAMGKSYNQVGQVQQAVDLLQKANSLEPSEATFTDELSLAYARLATAVLDSTKDATSASQIAQRSLAMSDQTMQLNPVHLNFYKTRVRVLLTLAPYRPSLLNEAVQTLEAARKLSPTDPKLLYNLALIQLTQPESNAEGMRNLQKVIEIKPNYEAARMSLGDEYQKEGETTRALEQYQYILTNIQPNNEVAKQKIQELQSQPTQPKTATSSATSAKRYNTPQK
jgi:putative inorganic carbon (HCO3(-)) transporter